MTYFLLAVSLLLYTLNAPQLVGATATLSVTINPPLAPNETYANAWAAAGPTPAVVDPPCGTNGTGVRNSAGSKVECPTGASTGSLKSATATNGDRATASAWAQISSGVGTASAPVNIPSKPQVFAGAAAYAKANLAVPVIAKGAGKIGGNYTITYGNLTVNGWSEPVDNLTLIMVDDLGPKQIPDVLAKVLDEDSIKSLIEDGFAFAQPTRVYFRIPMVLQGNKDAKVKVGKPFYFNENLPKCPKNFQEKLQACLISEQSPSEKDFMPCKVGASTGSSKSSTSTTGNCNPDELKHSLDRTFEVKFYIPGGDLPDNVSVHEISCVKSRLPDQPPPKDRDICSLLLRPSQDKAQKN
jgi:hypothetical protein